MNDGTLILAVVCEARADFQIAAELADRSLCEHEHLKLWLEREHLAHIRIYRGRDDSEQWFLWRDMKTLARQCGIDFQGHFDHRPHAPDAVMATRAIRVVRRLLKVDAVLLIRDDDGVIERRVGFDQARQLEQHAVTVIIGLARTKRECWVLAGFEPRDDAERERLQNERSILGFDPREHADRLTAKHDAANDKRSAKRVLSALTQDDYNREAACWEETDLAILRSRGGETGLADFLAEVEERLVPLVTPTRPT